MAPQGLRINEVRVVIPQGSDDFGGLAQLSGGAQKWTGAVVNPGTPQILPIYLVPKGRTRITAHS
jgi:hypothetical protein